MFFFLHFFYTKMFPNNILNLFVYTSNYMPWGPKDTKYIFCPVLHFEAVDWCKVDSMHAEDIRFLKQNLAYKVNAKHIYKSKNTAIGSN